MIQHRKAFRRGVVLALPVAGVLALTACSAAGSGDGDANGFTFTYQTSNNLESPYATLAKEYMKSHPGVTITLNPQPNDRYGQTLRTQLQGGNASDLIQTAPGTGQPHSALTLAQAGFLEPLGKSAASLIPKGSDSLFYIGDKLYAQPVDFTVNGVVYNTTAAAKAGITKFPATTEELVQNCKTLSAKGMSFVALAGGAPPNLIQITQVISATRVYAENPDWNQDRSTGSVTFANTQGWRDTLQTIVDLNKAGCFQAGAQGSGFDAITNGLSRGTALAGFIPGGSAKELMSAAPDQKMVVQAFPPAQGGKTFTLGGSNYSLSVNAASTKKKAIQDFLDWLAQPQNAKRYAEISGAIPVSGLESVDLAGSAYQPVEPLLRSGSYAPLPTTVWPNESVADAISSGVQGLLTGQNTIDQVLAKMDAAWDQ
ncbi:extracellular solute-binding protein [Thermocatellispora tengchongensis]